MLIVLVAAAIPVWWFWFADISFATAVITTLGSMAGWYAAREMIRSDVEMAMNVFARAQFVGCMVGTACGLLSIPIRHLL